MGRLIHLILFLVLICEIGVARTPSKNGIRGFQLDILLFNNTPRCSTETRQGAQAIVSRILQRTGIEVRWIDCSLLADGTFVSQRCTPPYEPSSIILRLVPTSPATKFRFGRHTLGIAAQFEEGTHASASVFHDRVEQLAKRWLIPLVVVLSHAMAHEIGHLLLGTDSHSLSGLMKAHWSEKDLRRGAEGNLLFSSRQSATIRHELLKRRMIPSGR